MPSVRPQHAAQVTDNAQPVQNNKQISKPAQLKPQNIQDKSQQPQIVQNTIVIRMLKPQNPQTPEKQLFPHAPARDTVSKSQTTFPTISQESPKPALSYLDALRKVPTPAVVPSPVPSTLELNRKSTEVPEIKEKKKRRRKKKSAETSVDTAVTQT